MKRIFALLLLTACSSGDDTPGIGPTGTDSGDGAPTVDVVTPPDADAEAGTSTEGPIVGMRDRAGKPYVSLLLVSDANRESYNVDPVDFVLPEDPGSDPTFAADFQASLVKLDALDGKNDWDGGAADAGPDDAGVYPHPLENSWLSVDALLVDPNKPFSATSYLDVEINPTTHATCGGRWVGDDALDKTLSYLVKKSLTGIRDGVDAPAKAPTMTFPYLASPF